MRRLLALLAAVAMVAVSLYVRARLDDSNGDGDSGSDGTGVDSGTFRVVCVTELAGVCQDLPADVSVTVEEAPMTADRLVAEADPELDAWLVPTPWPAMVDEARADEGLPDLFADDAPVLARSPLAVVGGDDLDDCDWRCLGEGTGSGALDLGWRDPASGFGLLAVGAATAGYFADKEVGSIATNDFDAAFRSYLAELDDGAEPYAEPVTAILQTRALLEAAISYEAEATAALDGAAPGRKEGLVLLYPEPVASVVVVLATATTADAAPEDLSDMIGTQLTDTGWGGPSGDGNGLPRAGVMRALRAEVS